VLSFDKISKEINTSKPTLLKWNEELEKDIDNLSYLEVGDSPRAISFSENQ
jgi:hypothetical protein